MGDEKKIPAGMEPLPDLAERRAREQEEKARARQVQRQAGQDAGGMKTPFPVFGAADEVSSRLINDEENTAAGALEIQTEQELKPGTDGKVPTDKGGPDSGRDPQRDSNNSRQKNNNNNGKKNNINSRQKRRIGVGVGLCAAAAVALCVWGAGRSGGSAGAGGSADAGTVAGGVSAESVAAASDTSASGMENTAEGGTELSGGSGGGVRAAGVGNNAAEQSTAGTEQLEAAEAGTLWPAGNYQSGGDLISLPELNSAAVLVVDTDKGNVIAEKLPAAGEGGRTEVTKEAGADAAGSPSGSEAAVRVPENMADLLILRDVSAGTGVSGEAGGANLQQTVTISGALIDAAEAGDLPVAGFTAGERVTLQDCLYGMILANGAEARGAVQAVLEEKEGTGSDGKLTGEETSETSGSDENAADLAKGLSEAGTAGDSMEVPAVSLAAAMQQAVQEPAALKVLSAVSYTTSTTKEHPEGLTLTGTFLQRMQSQAPEGTRVLAARSGYSEDAGACAVSLAEISDQNDEKRSVICVTCGADNAWQSVYDLSKILNSMTS